METLLEVEHISCSWQDERVVDDVNFSLSSGELACFIGKSGVGKSTLFHCIAGLEPPTKGRILLKGKDITAKPGFIAYMLQKDLLLPWKSVWENVLLPLKLAHIDDAHHEQQAMELLTESGLAKSKDLFADELSGGMRQRVAFVRTLLMNKEVMLIDEPFSALDAITRLEMRTWLLSMVAAHSLSCMCITHDIEEALILGDSIYMLKEGENGAGATCEKVFSNTCAPNEREAHLQSEQGIHIKHELQELLIS